MQNEHIRRKSSLPELTEAAVNKHSRSANSSRKQTTGIAISPPSKDQSRSFPCPCGSSVETDSSVCSQCDTHICLSGSYEKHYHSDTELLNPKLRDFIFQDSSVNSGASGNNSVASSSSMELSKQFTYLSDKTLDCGATSYQNTVVAIPGRTFNTRGRCRLCFRERCQGCRYFISYSKVNVSVLPASTSVPNVNRSYKSSVDGSELSKKPKKFTKDQKLTLFCIGLINLTAFLSMSIIAPFFPQEASLKGMRESVSGMVFSVYALVVMLVSPLFGKIAPHVGIRFMYLSGIFISGCSNILFGLLAYIENETLFAVFCFVVRSFEALGAAAFSTAANIIILESFPDDIGTVFGLIETCTGVGMSLGPAIGGGLYSLGGYGLPFYVLGTCVLLNLPLNCYFLNIPVGNSVRNKKSTYRNLLSIPLVIIISVVVVVASQAQGFLDPTLEPHFRQFNLGPEIVGLLFLLLAAAYALFSPVVGYFTGKFEIKYPMMLVGLLVMTVSLLLLGPSPFLPFDGGVMWINILAIVLLGVSFACAFIPTFEAIFNASIAGGLSDDLGTYSIVSGLWTAMFSLGEVTGPTLGGILSDFLTFPQAATVMALCSFLTAILISITWMCSRKQRYCKNIETESDSGISETSLECENEPLIKSNKLAYGSADIGNIRLHI